MLLFHLTSKSQLQYFKATPEALSTTIDYLIQALNGIDNQAFDATYPYPGRQSEESVSLKRVLQTLVLP